MVMQTCWSCGRKMRVIKDKPYQYKECGLSNVYLHGVQQVECECGEGGPVIPRIKELHLLIARELICKEGTLAGAEIKFLRKGLGVKSKEMAQLLQITPQHYSKYENSKTEISSNHDMQARLLYILNAEEEFGQVLHEGLRFIQRIAQMEEEDRKERKKGRKALVRDIVISASEWLMPIQGPIFTESCA